MHSGGGAGLGPLVALVTPLELVGIQIVEFQKLELKLSAHETNKSVFLFLSPIPRFNFGINNNFRTYNLLV
jgi:hypothetical protein